MPLRKEYGGRTPVLLFLLQAVLFIATATAILFVVKSSSREISLQEAREKAELLLVRNQATHAYVAKELRPSVFKVLKEGSYSSDYFDPTWMSSSYIVRGIDRYFKEDKDFRFYNYKDASIDARSDVNMADDVEREFINRLNQDPGLNVVTDIRTIGGTPYFVTMKRGEFLEERCLMCHSTPENAPAGLVERYGPLRGFNKTANTVVSALSVRVPLSKAYAMADRLFRHISAWLLLMLSFLFVTQVIIFRHISSKNSALSREIVERTKAEERLTGLLEEKEVLMQEIHHRVKNNLAIVASLLEMQTGRSDNAEAVSLLKSSTNRIRTMALVHEHLYTSEQLTDINVNYYVRKLFSNILSSYSCDIRTSIEVQQITLDISRLIPLGLILNEILTNAVKHAFGEAPPRPPFVSLSIGKTEDDHFVVSYEDNGRGLPTEDALFRQGTLGGRIIRSLVQQLGGIMEISACPDLKGEGLRITITCPLSERKEGSS